MKKSRLTLFALLATAALLHAGPVKEVPPPPITEEADAPGGFLLQIENDLWGGSDEYYTSGLRLIYGIDTSDGAMWFGADTTTISLAQAIYNPSDIYRNTPDPTDRPYAGYLHLGIGLHNLAPDQRRRDSFGLDLGVVGPSSLGEDAQYAYHDWRDLDRPTGWEEQIKDEPVIQFSYELQMRPGFVKTPRMSGWEWDQLVFGGANVGNGFITAEAGTELRAGWNLAPRWATSMVAPSYAAGSPLPWAEGMVPGKPTLTTEVFAGARGRLVGRDITLDGNTFRDSVSVDKKIAVADLYAGFGWGYGWFSMTFTETFRTEEFEGQEGGQFLGTLTLGVTF